MLSRRKVYERLAMRGGYALCTTTASDNSIPNQRQKYTNVRSTPLIFRDFLNLDIAGIHAPRTWHVHGIVLTHLTIVD